MMAADEEGMAEKKLRGSGGYAIAKVSDDEQKMANLGGPELFLAGIGRLDSGRFVKYFCNRCERDFEGAPTLSYENPNEDLGEGVTLAEKGEYRCRACNATIAQYRKFSTPAQQQQQQPPASATMAAASAPAEASMQPQEWPASMAQEQQRDGAARPMAAAGEGFVSIQQIIGMAAYDSDAMLVGKVQQVGLRRSEGKATIAVRIAPASDAEGAEQKEVEWDNISKIGDIILLGSGSKASAGPTSAAAAVAGKCPSCGYLNEAGALFCEECGAKLT
jgi:sporulation protein YlmC with PRC-barrel domain